MTEPRSLTDAQINVLKFMHQDQRGEMQYRREREYRVFTWSSSLLSALIAALLITKQTDLVWKSYGIWGNVTVSAAVLLIVLYSTRWLERNKRFRGQNAHVIARIEALLHCFEKGYFTMDDTPLFPPAWAAFGAQRQPSAMRRRLDRLFAANYVSAIVLLGILAVIMIWLPG